MRTLPVALAGLLLLAGCGITQPSSAPQGVSTPNGSLRVTRIADGDTFTGKDASGTTVKVRLLGIDAPELAHDGNAAGCGASEAAARLKELIYGHQVQLIADPRSDAVDRYGRRLAYVELDGADINARMVTDGWAEAWYPSGEPRPQRYDGYARAEATARDAKVGSWASCPSLGR